MNRFFLQPKLSRTAIGDVSSVEARLKIVPILEPLGPVTNVACKRTNLLRSFFGRLLRVKSKIFALLEDLFF